MSSSVEARDGLNVVDIASAGTRWRVALRLDDDPHRHPPLLLCNGLGANWELFNPLIAALPKQPLIAFDVPGVGGSPPLAAAYRLPRLARLVVDLLDRLGVRRFDALGVSWGGALAQQIALNEGARCRRLVLAATSTGALSFPGRWSAIAALGNARRYGGGQESGDLAEAYGGRTRTDPRLLHEYLRLATPPSKNGYRHQLFAIAGWTSAWWLPLLQQPALILAGDDDPLVPLSNAHLMHRLLRSSRLEVIDDGHLFLHTRATEMARRIATFVNA